jgi:ferrous iron transport protein B
MLSEASVGLCYRVTAVRASGAIRQRMLDMGLVPGVHITVMRFAPLGDPIEIRINRFFMSLRREEASFVEVRPIGVCPRHGRRRFRRFFHGRR